MMAEVTIDTQVNIETTDEEKDGHLRRFSKNGVSNGQNLVAKRGSRYRSASSGSCHDLCKHGFKSDPETKVRRSLVRTNSVDSTRRTAKTYEVVKKVPESPKKVSISLRRQTSSPAEMKDASEKHLRVPKPKTSSLVATQRLRRRHSEITIPKSSESLYVSPRRGLSGQTNSEKKVNKETENSKIEKKKILAREKFSLSSMPSPKRILSAQSEYVKKLKKVPSTIKIPTPKKEVEGKYSPNEYVLEKTPYVIGPQARNQTVGLARRGSFTSSQFKGKDLGYGECKVKSSHSPPTEKTHRSLSSLKSQSSTSSSQAMQSDDSDFDIDYSESENSMTDLEVENMRTPRLQILRLKDKDRPSSHKLQFRRGNVIDDQFEDTSPSRLKFRHQEALENQDGVLDTGGISLRRILSDRVLYESNSETEKVTLKHQDTETKEETRALGNDVIEETANRLVRSRKSKVKALVGAFEAVLGRHDRKSEEMNRT